MDDRAKKILIKTFWSSKGWRFNCKKISDVIKEGFLTQEDFDYCREKGVMFHPITITHDECLARYYAAAERISQEQVIRAFICSLSTRKLYLRSAVSSYCNLLRMKKHTFEPSKIHSSYICGICDAMGMHGEDIYEEEDLTVLNFERVKWGGVRHEKILYCMFDLEQFPADFDGQPTTEDIRYLKEIIRTIETSKADDGPTQLRERLRKSFPSNKDEAGVMVEILCELKILTPSKTRPVRGGKNDWGRVEDWRGEDGYNRNRVDELFGAYM